MTLGRLPRLVSTNGRTVENKQKACLKVPKLQLGMPWKEYLDAFQIKDDCKKHTQSGEL